MFSIALLPILSTILVGFFIKRKGFVPDDFWPAADRLSYFIFFPAFLITKIATMELEAVPAAKLAIAIVSIYSIISLLLFIVMRITSIEKATFTSVYQGATRFNTYMVLLIIISIWGTGYALNVALLISGMMIILVNLLCLSVFSYCTPNKDLSKIKMVLYNPLILSCVVGLLINGLSIPVPQFIYGTFDLLGRVALTLGLLSVGAGLIIRFNDWVSFPVVLAIVARLIIMPFLAYLAGLILQLDPITHSVLVLMFGVPTAISGYVLSRQLGGDLQSMAKIITIQTMVSFATLSVILVWVNQNINAT